MDVKNELMEFILTKENNGALLLSGKWGCGKSYLIKEIARELNSEESYAVAIISLFGISTISELDRRIKEEYLELSSTLLGKTAQKAMKILSSIAKEGTAVASAALPEVTSLGAISQGISSVVSFDAFKFVKVKNTIGADDNKIFVLVFDDFERTEIPVKQLLGTINDYTENREIKTVIIADEDKVSDENYSEFKEKVISRTVKLSSDYPKIICSILNSYKETHTGYKTFLIEHQKYIIRAFLDSTSENIRTAKTFIMDFERVYYTWKKSEVSLEKIGDVLYAFGAVMFEYKANNYEKDPRHGYIFSASKLREKYSGLVDSCQMQSLQEWITGGMWDECKFVDELRRKFNITLLSNEQKFLVYRFWDLDGEIIESGLPAALERAYAGDLARDELIRLLQNVQWLKSYRVNLPCDVDFSRILSALVEREERIKTAKIEEPPSHTFIVREMVEEMDPVAQEIYQRIERMDEKITAWKNRQSVISCLKGEEGVSRYDLKHHFLISFDEELLRLFCEQYPEQENCQKREYFLLIKDLCFDDKRVSNREDMKTTILNFERLEKQLTEFKETCQDPIARIITEESIKLVPDIIESLRKMLN